MEVEGIKKLGKGRLVGRSLRKGGVQVVSRSRAIEGVELLFEETVVKDKQEGNDQQTTVV